jgi:hypothetical protein
LTISGHSFFVGPGYTYLIKSFDELPSYQTSENYSIPQFELKTFVDVNDKERVYEWFQVFELHSKTTMAQTKGYSIKGKKVLVQEKRHCIHSNEVKKSKVIMKPSIHNHPMHKTFTVVQVLIFI